MRRLTLLACALCCLPATAAADVPLPGVKARSIGPATMGGRVTALAVVEGKPATHYVGAASGGLWKTTDNGQSWHCAFPGRPHPSIGAVAVAPSNPNVVYVGTGEANARNSVSWGNGVFRSRDGGKTWDHVGLADSRHIGRIVVHPKDPDTAYVAALGRLWGKNAMRGVFRTRDGGKSWDHVLKLDDDTGCIDLAMSPADPGTLLAAAYCVRRDGFAGGNPEVQFGPKAGLYRTTDGGAKWSRVTRGLPTRPFGRIGLDFFRKDANVVFAVVQTDRTAIAQVAGQPEGPPRDLETGGIFRSADGGASWTKLNNLCPRPFYFGVIRVDPVEERRVWVLGIPLFYSSDGGKSFTNDGAPRVHVDHHDLWINPADPRHMILGNDGGLYYSRDRGKSYDAIKNFCISQFYGVGVDMGTPYRVYGGLQDNGSWGGPTRTNNTAGILSSDFTRVIGADGFQCAVPPGDPLTVYAEAQYGRLQRFDRRTNRATNIQPRSPNKETVYRFNWNAPILISPHGGQALYFGGNHLFRSDDRGAKWQVLGGDLTAGKPTERYRHTGHTLTAIAESPLRKGLLYVGSDDGKVHVSVNGGQKWQEVTHNVPGAPAARWVTRLECSPHKAETAWLSFTRHRQDDTAPYLFRTDDAGKTWRSVVGNLPKEGPVHVVRASSRHPELLFAGTEFNVYVSFDGGQAWQAFGGLPPVPVHDLVIHPRERELVIGTHGRGIYVADIGGLEELTAKVRAGQAHLCKPREVARPGKAVTQPPPPHTYAGSNPPAGAAIAYWLKGKEKVSLEILDVNGGPVAALPAPGAAGLQQAYWDLKRTTASGARELVPAGEYVVRLRAGGVERTAKLRVKGP